MPEPKKTGVFAGLEEKHGFFTSKDYLPKVAAASKPGKNMKNITQCEEQIRNVRMQEDATAGDERKGDRPWSRQVVAVSMKRGNE